MSYLEMCATAEQWEQVLTAFEPGVPTPFVKEFQNAIAEAPNQVILEMKEGGNGFTLEMNYNGKNAYTRDQTMYMTNRNFVDKNKAVRNLKRSSGKK